jgi:uncharacterized protein DUF1348
LCGDVGGATAPEVRTDGEVSRVQPANQSQQTRPPLPPFTEETARQMVKMAEDAWNTRDPERVALAYTEDSEWRNRDEFFEGREAIKDFLRRKWARVLDYRLEKNLWCLHGEPHRGQVRVREPRRGGTVVEISPLRPDCNTFPPCVCRKSSIGSPRGGRTRATPERPARH